MYAPGWFTIKAQSSFLHGPRILFKLLQAVKKLNDPVCSAVFEDKLQNWAFPLLSENFLASMLYSNVEWDRKMAAWKINELKRVPGPPIGSARIQPLNFEAESWGQLISLSSAESEPPITKRLSEEQVNAMVKNPRACGALPKFPIHTQSVERAVKNVSEAAPRSWSVEKRHKSICATEDARAKRPFNNSKQDFVIDE